MKPIMLHSFPRAILHVDADAFFASVEQSIHPELKGLPVITGAERGIVAAASYEAKALGIKRGVSLREVKKIAPNCVLIPSDYETYSLYSKRIFSILRRFTPTIEEYSIDEAFADITGLRRLYRCSYIEIAKKIQQTIHRELDITVSVGVSLSKSLCKLASKWDKPRGITAIPGRLIHEFLLKTPILNVWGFGDNITNFLNKKGVTNAYEYISQHKNLVHKWLGKVGLEIWQELHGALKCRQRLFRFPGPTQGFAEVAVDHRIPRRVLGGLGESLHCLSVAPTHIEGQTQHVMSLGILWLSA